MPVWSYIFYIGQGKLRHAILSPLKQEQFLVVEVESLIITWQKKIRKRNTEYYFIASYCFIRLFHSPWPQDLSPFNCGLNQWREHVNKYRSFKNEQHLKLNSKSKLQWIPNVFGSTFLCFTSGNHCRLGSEHMYAQSMHHAWCHTAQYQKAL